MILSHALAQVVAQQPAPLTMNQSRPLRDRPLRAVPTVDAWDDATDQGEPYVLHHSDTYSDFE